MTRLLVLSDLHLEQRPLWTFPKRVPPFDVAVFAGDVDAPPEAAVHRLAAESGLAGRPIVYVPGNHEFYRGCLEERLAAGRVARAASAGDGDARVHLLAPGVAVLAGVRFVGATLWTDYRLYGDRAKAMDACRRWLTDHRLIEVGPSGARRPFQPVDALARHREDRAFIEAVLAEPFAGPTVVVTHHAPHPGSVAPRFAGDPFTAGFVSDLQELILRDRPELWVHGHNHDSFDYHVGPTRIVANPKGYGPRRQGSKPENAAFDETLVVEVGDASAHGSSAAGPDLATETIEVVGWTILRVRAVDECHVIGFRRANGRGRTSSPIRAYDRVTRIATTASGNRYVLVGAPSDAGLDDVLVRHWLSRHGLTPADVEIVREPEL